MYKIVVIIPFFGTFTNYFNFWLYSASKNKNYDFLIVNDFDHPEIKYSNIKFLKMNLANLKELASSKLGFNISFEYSYKKCDYKPAYGLIFEDYIKDYDYWGYCDVDLIFGNLDKYVTNDKLEKYLKLYKLGHFSLTKNNQDGNDLFKRRCDNALLNYKLVYSTNKNFGFDELFLNDEFASGQLYSGFGDFSQIMVRYKNFQVFNESSKTNNAIFEYDDGSLYIYFLNDKKELVKEETMYAHFQKRKISVETDNLTHYLIVPNKIIEYQTVTKRFLKKQKHCSFFYYLKIRINNLKHAIEVKRRLK